MELDIFIPTYSLAFEYQGAYHYRNSFLMSSAYAESRDAEKREACVTHGVSLIEIPYWAKLTRPSLITLILTARPDFQCLM